MTSGNDTGIQSFVYKREITPFNIKIRSLGFMLPMQDYMIIGMLLDMSC